ncbi:MAG: hypothetical protein ACXW2I_18100 [Burkholderiales bacterium]
MTSASKIRANQLNAKASTGPKTAKGRARSAQNALGHGLSLPVHADPVLSEQVEMLARQIAGPGAVGDIQYLAGVVAEAQIDLQRVRTARHHLLSHALADSYYERVRDSLDKLKCFRRAIPILLRPDPPAILERLIERYLVSTPQGPFKFVTILSEESRHLLAMDRYERRAMSRRKFAIRALDEARHRKA